MGSFVLVEQAVWTDPDFRALSTDARLLFLWSWTNPDATKCGLYRASEKMLQRALGEPLASLDRVRSALNELAKKPLVLYDPDNEVIFVVNRVRYANRSEKVLISMQREIEFVPPSPLVAEFVRLHGATLKLELVE